MNHRRWSRAGALIVVALVATACAGGAGDSVTSTAPALSTAPMTSAPDDFTEVPTSDGDATTGTPSVATASSPDGTVAGGSTDTATTSTSGPSSTEDSPRLGSNADGSDGDGTDETSSSATTTSTSTTVSAGTGASEPDQALANAFTIQLDADDGEDFGEVFDTTCLGTELVVAFGGAGAADAEYGLNVTTVNANSDLFNLDPLSKASADAVVAAFGRCGDFDNLLLLDLTGSAADNELSRCVVNAMPDGAQEAAFSQELQQVDGPALDAFDDAVDDAFDMCFE